MNYMSGKEWVMWQEKENMRRDALYVLNFEIVSLENEIANLSAGDVHVAYMKLSLSRLKELQEKFKDEV